MALRMAQDLGLQHEVSIQSIPNEKHQEKARLLFWAVIGLDRITTFGTGRPVSIRESEIDIELPKLSEGSDMKDETVVFGHVIRILMLRGRMGELLNRREKEESSISGETTKRDLTRMWFELAQSYSDLPANLHFNVQTFQKSAALNQSAGFVYLHVLFQSTIGLLDRPALMKKFTGDSAPLLPSFAPAASAAASRTIADILTLGDAFDDRCITASPYLDQLVLPAGRSFVAEREAAREALRNMGHGTTPAPSRPPSRGAGPQQQSRTSALVSTKSYAEITSVHASVSCKSCNSTGPAHLGHFAHSNRKLLEMEVRSIRRRRMKTHKVHPFGISRWFSNGPSLASDPNVDSHDRFRLLRKRMQWH